MSDQTPRMPNFWWCSTHHLYRGGDERPCADAVKLGDDEALRAEVQHWRSAYERLFAIGEERAGQFDEIRAVLDDAGAQDPKDDLADIRAIVEREEPEEGSPSAIAAEELAALTPPKAAAPQLTPGNCDVLSPNGRKRCVRELGHDGEHMSGVVDGMWSTPTVVEHQPADSDDEYACPDGCGGCGCHVGHAAPCSHCTDHWVEHQPAQDSEPGVVTVDVEVDLTRLNASMTRALLESTRWQLRSVEAERDQLKTRIDEHKELLHCLWLYVKWRYVTKQLTTEQKNLWADAVEEMSERDHPGEGATADRWWQDPAPVATQTDSGEER